MTGLTTDLKVTQHPDRSFSMLFKDAAEYEASINQVAFYFGQYSEMFTVIRKHGVEHDDGKVEIKFRLEMKSHD